MPTWFTILGHVQKILKTTAQNFVNSSWTPCLHMGVCVWVCQQIQNVQSKGRKTELNCQSNKQGYTNPKHQITTVTTFCTVVPNACGSSAWILFQVIFLTPRIVRCLLHFFNRRAIAFPFNIIKTKLGGFKPNMLWYWKGYGHIKYQAMCDNRHGVQCILLLGNSKRKCTIVQHFCQKAAKSQCLTWIKLCFRLMNINFCFPLSNKILTLLYCKLLLNSRSLNCVHVGINIKTVQNFFCHGATDPKRPGPPHYWGFTITLRHTTLSTTSGQVISPTQRPLIDNTTPTTDKAMPPSGIQICNPRKWMAADPCLRPHSH